MVGVDPETDTQPCATFSEREIEATHAVFDLAHVPRSGRPELDQPLTLEQRATILVRWYQQGSRR